MLKMLKRLKRLKRLKSELTSELCAERDVTAESEAETVRGVTFGADQRHRRTNYTGG
jgi:hypothetical protein